MVQRSVEVVLEDGVDILDHVLARMSSEDAGLNLAVARSSLIERFVLS